jgi:glycosyltransferase involved in cell wall biosynthesis
VQLSVVLVTRNEEELLDGCLSRLGFEDELIILDMHSTDRTREIAEQHGARIVTIDPDPFVVRVRNIGLDEAKGDWILYLDPDEYVPPGFGPALRKMVEQTDASAFYLPFRAVGYGRTLYYGDIQDVLPKRRLFGEQDLDATATWPTKMCLFKAGRARWPEDPPHNHVEPVIDGDIQIWDAEPVDHLLFRSVHQALEKHIRYVTNTKPGTYESRPLKGWTPIRILYNHMIVQKWWRDGTAGMAEAMLFTMKDWLSVLHEWELRGHPEIPVGRTAEAAFSTAEAVQGVATRTRQIVGAAKRRSRRLAALLRS